MKTMRKTLLVILGVMAMAVISCQNENTVNPRPNSEVIGKATITGKVEADIDNTTAEAEPVPDGTVVFATIDTRDLELNPSGGINYPLRNYQTTVTGGEFTFDDIDVGPEGIDVELKFTSFRTDVTAPDTTIVEDVIFGSFTQNVFVLPSETFYLDVTY